MGYSLGDELNCVEVEERVVLHEGNLTGLDMKQASDFYVYIIFRPNGVPCYVGKGRGKRIDHHARFSHNAHLRHIYKQNGGFLPHQKLVEGISDKEACEIERYFIFHIGRLDLKTGPLVNLCEGGEGLSGHIKSPETREKLSASRKGKSFSEEWRKNMSKSRLGKKRSQESIEKQRKTITGVPKPWVSEARKGKPAPWVRNRQLGTKNPEHSQKMKGNGFSLGKNSTISRQQAIEIRSLLSDGVLTQQQIADKIGVKLSNVCSIAAGRAWKELGPPIRKRGPYKLKRQNLPHLGRM